MILTLGTTPAVQRSMIFHRLTIDGVNRTADVREYASGKSVNAARVLRTLSHDVICTGFVGGYSGKILVADLDNAKIKHSFVHVDPPTRLCITLVDRSNETATELIEESCSLPEDDYEQLLLNLRELLPRTTSVMLCGSLPPKAPQNFYAECVAIAISAGKLVLLDAVGQPLQKALNAKPTIIKPNRQELSQTVKAPVETDSEMKSAIQNLLSMGPSWAVVTNGAKETIASDGKSFWKISTPKVAVVSPIGSGDSFAAGLVAGVTAGQTVFEACRLAAACGAANAMTPLAGHLNRSDVDRLLVDITIKEF